MIRTDSGKKAQYRTKNWKNKQTLSIEKIPDELITNYINQARKGSPVIEHLKIAAALKLWNDRSFRDIRFDVPMLWR